MKNDLRLEFFLKCSDKLASFGILYSDSMTLKSENYYREIKYYRTALRVMGILKATSNSDLAGHNSWQEKADLKAKEECPLKSCPPPLPGARKTGYPYALSCPPDPFLGWESLYHNS